MTNLEISLVFFLGIVAICGADAAYRARTWKRKYLAASASDVFGFEMIRRLRADLQEIVADRTVLTHSLGTAAEENRRLFKENQNLKTVTADADFKAGSELCSGDATAITINWGPVCVRAYDRSALAAVAMARAQFIDAVLHLVDEKLAASLGVVTTLVVDDITAKTEFPVDSLLMAMRSDADN